MNNIQGLQTLGQSIWLDFISRSLLTGGGLKKLVNDGVTGVTSNPSIFQKAIGESHDYDQLIARILKSEPAIDIYSLYEKLAVEDIQMAADVLRPVYDSCNGEDGFVSLEVSPRLANDTGGTVEEARRLWRAVDRPNVMIKVPGTPAGTASPGIITPELKIVLTGAIPMMIVPVVKPFALATALLVNSASDMVAPVALMSAVPAISRASSVRLRRRSRRGVS